jgi:hypothetical protein
MMEDEVMIAHMVVKLSVQVAEAELEEMEEVLISIVQVPQAQAELELLHV